ncbi:MAG: hypothetical protein U0R64_07395 [Candidatus Nanopelagicales bacterium]
MYAFDAALGGSRVGQAWRQLAHRSGLPRSSVTVVDRSTTYAHIDPLSADPARNAFTRTVSRFLNRLDDQQPPVRPGRG